MNFYYLPISETFRPNSEVPKAGTSIFDIDSTENILTQDEPYTRVRGKGRLFLTKFSIDVNQ